MQSVLIRIVVSIIFAMIIVVWYLIPDRYIVGYDTVTVKDGSVNMQANLPTEVEDPQSSTNEETLSVQESPVIKDNVKLSVPFVAQAPHAQWDDPQYQDACEEASILMAHAWATGSGNISKNDAEKEMEKMFEREKELFGEDVIDTSAQDTARLYEIYFGKAAAVRENVTMEDLYALLSQDKIIIVPTNGKALGNPNFTDGGPDRHMLVIIGFDREKREFITNDPGTRLGRGYKYKDSTLFNAIRDYATGHKEEIIGARKNIIVIEQ
jgi:hypothetical protein